MTGMAAMTASDREAIDLRRKMAPVLVDATLKGAASGRPEDVDALFSMMIRSWPRLAGNVRKIRDAAARAPFSVHAASGPDGIVDPRAEERAALVRRVLSGMRPAPASMEMDWTDARRFLAEATIRGTGVLEMLWHTTDDGEGQMAGIRAMRMVHPRYYAWSRAANAAGEDRLMFTAQRGGHGQPWPENQFAIQLAPAWNEHPAVSALLGTLAMWWIAATYGPQWVMNYAQFFGIPFRWANYPTGDASARDVVSAMLQNIGSAGWAALPEGTTLNLLESSKGAGDLPQKLVIDIADQVCDILLLGQTLTTSTSGVGSQALGNVHEGVQFEILESICGHVARTATTQIVPPILLLNYGDTEFAPEVCSGLEEPEDEKAKAERDEIILRSGVQIPRAWYYKRHGIPMPGEGEETIGTMGVVQTPAAPGSMGRSPGAVRAAAAAAGVDDRFVSDLTAVFETTLSEAVRIGWESMNNQIKDLAAV